MRSRMPRLLRLLRSSFCPFHGCFARSGGKVRCSALFSQGDRNNPQQAQRFFTIKREYGVQISEADLITLTTNIIIIFNQNLIY